MAMDVRENQARIAEVLKLKTAAVLQLRENLSPADALKRADLPADVQNSSLWSGKLRKMRGHLKQHLDDWVADDWGGRASPSPTSAASATSSPLSTPRESAAAPTPKVFLTIPQNEEIPQIIVATVHQRQCAELPQCAEPGDIEQRSEFLRMVVEFMLVDDAANMPAYWENAMQVAQVAQSDLVQYAAKFEHDVNGAFELELQLHCTCRTNHVLGISRGMVDLVRACCATVATELLIMHRRQSKDLLSWRPSMSERRMYHFVLATNAELESLLGTVDHETREKRTQSTYATGALSSFSCCILGSIPRRMPLYRSCCCCLSFLPLRLLHVTVCFED